MNDETMNIIQRLNQISNICGDSINFKYEDGYVHITKINDSDVFEYIIRFFYLWYINNELIITGFKNE